MFCGYGCFDWADRLFVILILARPLPIWKELFTRLPQMMSLVITDFFYCLSKKDDLGGIWDWILSVPEMFLTYF